MTWYVYGIASEDAEDDPFYIGITTNYENRASQHNGRDSAAYDRSKALESLGKDCVLYILARYETEAEARAYETAMIAMRADRLVNRTLAQCVRAFNEHFLAETVNADG